MATTPSSTITCTTAASSAITGTTSVASSPTDSPVAFLKSIQATIQARHKHAFEADAPPAHTSGDASTAAPKAKYMLTFPFPYMNGRPHLGHAFTVSKVEFMARYKRLRGYNVLLPFAFHCTGMPIQAAADKLKAEYDTHMATSPLPSRLTGTQTNILRSMSIPESELAEFRHTDKWLSYFPSHTRADLDKLGVSVDWRRSFITTDLNPVFDSFVRWQYRSLQQQHDKLFFGSRLTISYVDAHGKYMACADHDRTDGECVTVAMWSVAAVPVVHPQRGHINLLVATAGSNDSVSTEVGVNAGVNVGTEVDVSTATTYELFMYKGQTAVASSLTHSCLQAQDTTTGPTLDIIGCEELQTVTGIKVNVTWVDHTYLGTGIVSSAHAPTTTMPLVATYGQPAARVTARSGQVCVVAPLDQWYLRYGENDAWRQSISDYIASNQFETYAPETRQGLMAACGWMKAWACCRQYGLGSTFPTVDGSDSGKVESLSDSTVYMAYYTVAHLLQPLARALSEDEWNYVLAQTDTVPLSADGAVLTQARREFEYWYPLDVRVSGKDLINNHLLFSLYQHQALFGQSKMPRAFRVNGHLLLNDHKMSKNTGNFITLSDAVDKYSAEATRLTLALAGDGIDDANFRSDTADSCGRKLVALMEWYRQWVSAHPMTEDTTSTSHITTTNTTATVTSHSQTFFDDVFEQRLWHMLHAVTADYDKMLFRQATHKAFIELPALRDGYLEVCSGRVDATIFKKYLLIQLLLLWPVVPHVCEHIYTDILGQTDEPMWPSLQDVDMTVLGRGNMVDSIIETVKSKIKVLAKRGQTLTQATVTVSVCAEFSPWQARVVELLTNNCTTTVNTKLTKDQALMEPLLQHRVGPALAFAAWYSHNTWAGQGDEVVFMINVAPSLQRVLGCKELKVVKVDKATDKDCPGQPQVRVSV